MDLNKKPVSLVAREEEDQVTRRMVAWSNTFPELPDDLAGLLAVNYEQLVADAPCMAFSTIQSTYILQRYILGGYKAELQFKIIYRIKPGNNPNMRLEADELLDRFGDWARTQRPDIGENKRVTSIEATTRSAVFAAYENGDEDHQILMKMQYEVNV